MEAVCVIALRKLGGGQILAKFPIRKVEIISATRVLEFGCTTMLPLQDQNPKTNFPPTRPELSYFAFLGYTHIKSSSQPSLDPMFIDKVYQQHVNRAILGAFLE